MFITIITDASICTQTKICAYAYWIASDRGTLPGTGLVPTTVNNSLEGEVYSMIGGLTAAVNNGIVYPTDSVLIQNDSVGALSILMNSSPPPDSKRKKQVREAHAWFYNYVEERRLQVSFRHVKGHTNNPEPRYAANRYCDTEARALMRHTKETGFVPRPYRPKYYTKKN